MKWLPNSYTAPQLKENYVPFVIIRRSWHVAHRRDPVNRRQSYIPVLNLTQLRVGLIHNLTVIITS